MPIGILVGIGATKLFIPDRRQKGVLVQAVFRSNQAILGMPLTQSLGGEAAVAVTSVVTSLGIPLYNISAVIVLETYCQRDGKKTKPPVQTNGMYAKSDDSRTWSTFDAVKEAAPYCEGIGFVLTDDDDIVFLDFDKCRCPAFDNLDKEISGGLNMVLPEVADHVRQLNSYTEVSPSGKGLHVFLKGRLSGGGRKKGIYEIYQTGRYLSLIHISEPTRPY